MVTGGTARGWRRIALGAVALLVLVTFVPVAIGAAYYAPPPNATSTVPGLIQLATDLGGTATAPTVVSVADVTTGVLKTANGGTNKSTNYTQWGAVYADTITSLSNTAQCAATTVVHGQGAGAPTCAAVNVSTGGDVTGTLPVANGGTGLNADVALGSTLLSGGVGSAAKWSAQGAANTVLQGNGAADPTFTATPAIGTSLTVGSTSAATSALDMWRSDSTNGAASGSLILGPGYFRNASTGGVGFVLDRSGGFSASNKFFQIFQSTANNLVFGQSGVADYITIVGVTSLPTNVALAGQTSISPGAFTTVQLPGTCTDGALAWDSTTTTMKRCKSNAFASLLTSVDYNWSAYSSVTSLAAAAIFGQNTVTNATTLTTGSNIAVLTSGTGTGTFTVKVCSDGTTCGSGALLTCTPTACNAQAGAVTACTVQNGGAVAAAATLTLSVSSACVTSDPVFNLTVHGTQP